MKGWNDREAWLEGGVNEKTGKIRTKWRENMRKQSRDSDGV